MQDSSLAYEIVLPLPPSVNAAYRSTGRGWYKTAAYKKWLEKAEIAYQQNYPENVTAIQGPVRAEYTIIQGDKRPRDIANYDKCLSDFLEGRFFENDAQIDLMILARQYGSKGSNLVHVYVQKMDEENDKIHNSR